MTILRWGKAAALVVVVAVSGMAWVGLRRGGEGPKARMVAQADDGSTVKVLPGPFTPSVTGRGVVEPSRARDVASRVEGTAILVTLRPEGSVVKEGDVVGQLDSAGPRDLLAHQRIVESQAEAASKQARLVREVAEYAVKESEESARLQRQVTPDGLALPELRAEVERAKADEERAREKWERERARTRALERQVADCTLIAPMAGLVEHVRDPGDDGVKVEEGATIAEGQAVFRVFDPADPMRLVVQVGESLVDRIKPGQTVRVEVAARPDGRLTGVVHSIAPRSANVDAIVIDLDPHAFSLRAGMAARVEIFLDEVEGVMQVPARGVYLSTDGGRAFVAVRDRQAVAWREVTLGRSNDRAVEVVAGLRPGERVVRDPSAGTGLDFLGKRPRGGDASRVQGRPAP